MMEKGNHQFNLGHTIISFWDSSGNGKSLFLQLLKEDILKYYHPELNIELIVQNSDHATETNPSNLLNEEISWDINRKIKKRSKMRRKHLMAINNQHNQIKIIEPLRSITSSSVLTCLDKFKFSDVVVIMVDFGGIVNPKVENPTRKNERFIDPDHKKRTDDLIDLSKYVKRSRFFREKLEQTSQIQPEKIHEKIDKRVLIKSIDRIIQHSHDSTKQFIICVIYHDNLGGTGCFYPSHDLREFFGREFDNYLFSWEQLPVLAGSIRDNQLRLSKLAINEKGINDCQTPSRFLFTILEEKEKNRIAYLENNVLQVGLLGSKRYKKYYLPYIN